MKSSINNKKAWISSDEIIVAITIILLFAFFAILPLRSNSIRHVVVFAGSIFFYILAFRRITTVRKNLGFFAQIFAFVSVIVFDILITVRQYDYEIFYSALNLLSLFILISTENTVVFSKRSINWLFYGTLILSGIVFLLSFSPVAYLFEDGRFNGSLVLGMTNSNVAGMMIAGLVNILLIFFVDRGRLQKFILLIVILMLMSLLIRTNCRSALICSVLVLVYVVLLRGRPLPNWLVLAPIIISIVFVPVYLGLYNSRMLNITILGKNFFSGRQFTYREYLELLTNSFYWLFGNYGEAKLSNAHNAPLCILSSFGLVGVSIIYWNFSKRMLQINRNARSFFSRMSIACLMSLFIQSSMEALMLTGIFPSIAIIYIYTLFADQNESYISGMIRTEHNPEVRYDSCTT